MLLWGRLVARLTFNGKGGEEKEMSLFYYRLKLPVTNLRAKGTGAHVELTIWVNHATAGTLCLRINELSDFALSFAAIEYGACLRTHHGGQGRGLVVDVIDSSLSDDVTVVSAVGTITTVGEVKELAGAGRSKSNGPV